MRTQVAVKPQTPPSAQTEVSRPQIADLASDASVPSPAHALQLRLLSALDEHPAVEKKLPLRWTLMGLFVTCAAFWALVSQLVFAH